MKTASLVVASVARVVQIIIVGLSRLVDRLLQKLFVVEIRKRFLARRATKSGELCMWRTCTERPLMDCIRSVTRPRQGLYLRSVDPAETCLLAPLLSSSCRQPEVHATYPGMEMQKLSI